MDAKTRPVDRMTLPQRYYTDPDVFRNELEHFYCQSWICAGRADQIAKPGNYFLREIGDESIIITRDEENQIRAFFNVCRHRGTLLCTEAEGSFQGRIQCGYHGWTYALDGKLVGAPHMEQASFCRQDYPLHEALAAVWDGHIFINLDRDAAPLETQLGELRDKFTSRRMQELRMVHRKVYDVKCNWKLLVVNYNECLHCPILHPLLNKMTHYLSGENEPPQRTYVGGSMTFREGVEAMSVDGKRRHEYLPGLREEDQQRVYYYTIYPNLFLSPHPDHVMTHTLWPRAVDRTEIICEWHFHPDAMRKPGFDGSDVVEFWDRTNREDWRVCELSQAGIKSRAYTPGPYSERECLPAAFDRMILEAERQANGSKGSGHSPRTKKR